MLYEAKKMKRNICKKPIDTINCMKFKKEIVSVKLKQFSTINNLLDNVGIQIVCIPLYIYYNLNERLYKYLPIFSASFIAACVQILNSIRNEIFSMIDFIWRKYL